MDITRFYGQLLDPGKSCQDLKVMRRNALAKGALEYARLAERVLDERFPNWRSVTRKGGSKPTVAMFHGHSIDFPSQKEAYVWLIDQFAARYPAPFKNIDWQKYIAEGPRTLYFARSLNELFATSPEHAADPTMYHRMAHGLFAKLILSEPQKLNILYRIGAVTNAEIGKDWDWNRRGADSAALTLSAA